MTTYEFKSGLRLALMKLENSLSSRDGSLPNPIVDLRYPEERMAARLVERLGLAPPIDVEKLCNSLADLSFRTFPIDIDGLCLDLKIPGKRPKVWVSKAMPPVRRRFTLAHEIGHIIIPWHRGTIIDDIEAPSSGEKNKYREMEAEANRFAAELLMPSAWATGLAERADHAAGLMHTLHQIAQVSFPAAFLKTAKFGRPGFVGAEVRNGLIVRSQRTPGTYSLPPEVNASIEHVKMEAAYEPRILHGTEVLYYWWQMREDLADPGGDLPDWRKILDGILTEIPAEYRYKTRASVNAMIGLAIGREPKGGDVGRIYRRGIEAAHNRENQNKWVARAVSHHEFKNYILARARDRANQ
ncbi:ImmA/IrrE family metallo-endopeptidase [Sphingomonas gei]|nr:ImmA/IrrE family metallo-endopeptidase [Sphingomonas gei]